MWMVEVQPLRKLTVCNEWHVAHGMTVTYAPVAAGNVYLYLHGEPIPFHPDEPLEQQGEKLDAIRSWLNMAYAVNTKPKEYWLNTCAYPIVFARVCEFLLAAGLVDLLSSELMKPFEERAGIHTVPSPALRRSSRLQ